MGTVVALATDLVKNANLVSRLLLALFFSCVLVGCGRAASTTKPKGDKPASTYFEVRVGEKSVQLQLAVTDTEMARGLMHRRDLGEHQGMIFIYPRPTRMSFYMRNTPTPLDIGYFTEDGVLREVYPMYPLDETTVPSRGERMKFAVEMNQGWYAANGVKPGEAKLDLGAVRNALSERGFDAEAVLRTPLP